MKPATIVPPDKAKQKDTRPLPPGTPKSARVQASQQVNPTVDFQDVDDYITGKLVGRRILTLDAGTKKERRQTMYDILVDNTLLVSVWGTAILDRRMSAVEDGRMVTIQYTGDVETSRGQSAAHDFQVADWEAS